MLESVSRRFDEVVLSGGRRNRSFNLTYIAHKHAKVAVVPEWMADRAVMAGHVATRFAPFDLALTSTGLHDVSAVALDSFETNLSKNEDSLL